MARLPFDDATARPIWPDLADMGERMELYDLTTDTGRDFDFEGYSVNVASMPEHATRVAQFFGQLKQIVPTWL